MPQSMGTYHLIYCKLLWNAEIWSELILCAIRFFDDKPTTFRTILVMTREWYSGKKWENEPHPWIRHISLCLRTTPYWPEKKVRNFTCFLQNSNLTSIFPPHTQFFLNIIFKVIIYQNVLFCFHFDIDLNCMS